MKHIYLTLFALLVGMTAWADAPLGYAIYGDVPAGFTNLTSAITLGDWGGGRDGFASGYLRYTGKGLGGNIGDGNYLSLAFSTAQTLNLTTSCRIHVVMRRENGDGDVQVSFCRDSWNSNRAGFIIPGNTITTEYQDFVLDFGDHNTSGWNSYGTVITDGDNTFAAGHVFRFCAVSGETINIQQVYIDFVYSPFPQSNGLGIMRLNDVPLYHESADFVPTGDAVGATLNVAVVSVGDQVLGRITPSSSFDAGFDNNYQMRVWKIDGTTPNKTRGEANSRTSSEIQFYIVDGLFGVGATTPTTISMRAKLWGQDGIRTTDHLRFCGGYVWTPTGDVTAPTATASWRYEDGNYVVTFTASDDSGELFYYVENTTTPHKQISMTPSFALTGVKEGDVIRCYAVDFDGNMSAPVEFTLPVCGNCFPVTF